MTGPAPSLRGVLSPVLTPFGHDGKPSAQRFVRHCRWLLDQGVGLAAFGTNSEANSLSIAEKMTLLDALTDAGLPASRMMPGTGACALPDAIAMTRNAVRAGCAGVLMLPPFYYKGVSDEGLFRGFASVIDAVADSRLRVHLYHIPGFRRVRGLRDVLAADPACRWRRLHHRHRQCQCHGHPQAVSRVAAAGCPGAASRARRTRALFQKHPIIAAMKAAIAWKSGDAQWSTVRPPLVALDAAHRAHLQADLEADGFTIPNAASLAGVGSPAMAAAA